jgi:hypothetical protein
VLDAASFRRTFSSCSIASVPSCGCGKDARARMSSYSRCATSRLLALVVGLGARGTRGLSQAMCNLTLDQHARDAHWPPVLCSDILSSDAASAVYDPWRSEVTHT